MAGFNSNMSWNSESGRVLCENHPPQERREIELCCRQCNVFLCWKCKSTHHPNHVTEGVENTAARSKVKVDQMKSKLRVEIDQMNLIADNYKQQHKAIRDKRKTVKKEIDRRFSMLSEILTSCHQEALTSLEAATTSSQSQLPLDDIEKTVQDLESLHRRMDMCRGEASRVLMSAATIEKDVESKAAMVLRVHERSNAAGDRISMPMLLSNGSADTAAQACRDFLGTVTEMDMAAVPSEMEIKMQFRINDNRKHYDIYSLLPSRALDTVYVAYDTNPAKDPSQVPPDKFDQNGSVVLPTSPVNLHSLQRGRTSFTITGDNRYIEIMQETGFFLSYARSRRRCFLRNNLKGSATVITKLDAPDPVYSRFQYLNLGNDSSETQLAVIQCGPHRSFDIHATKPIIAIVEEGPDSRSVIVFFNGERKPYGSPIQPYLPSDVCFYKLNGRDVLLIADELNDTIHVVDVQTWQVKQYLAPGCPLVIQPTALGVDINTGQLWVACRGGVLLVCGP